MAKQLRIDGDKRRSEHIPFKELEACPECGSRELKKVHNRRYPGKEGIYTVVIYRCPKGHETFSRQLDTRIYSPAWYR
jgi:transposase-like protein